MPLEIEFARLLLGVLIAVFHRPLALRIMEQERAIDHFFRSRGFCLPAPLSDSAAQNFYFSIGIFICLLQAARLFLTT